MEIKQDFFNKKIKINVCIFALFDARMKKIKKRLGMKMRIRERQIARYYRGLLRELNEC